MTTTLERVSGALYRIGRRRHGGETSLASYTAGPVRIVAGELAASVADVLVSRTQGSRRPKVIGPSVP